MGLTKYIRPYRMQFIIACIAKLAEAFLELYLPILMAVVLDVGVPSGNRTLIISTGGKMLGLAVLGFACALICQYFASVTAQGSGTHIRNALINKISQFSYKELDEIGTSSLINRMTSDVNNYQWAIALAMRLVTRAPFICIGAVVMSLQIDKELAIIFFLLIPILGIILYTFMRYASPFFKIAQQKLDKFTLIVKENLGGIRVIRAFANAQQEEKRANIAASEICDANIYVGSISAWMQPLNSLVMNLGIIAILYFGANRVFAGYASQGDLLSLAIYATKILYAVVVTANLVVVFTKASASGKRISEILDKEPSITYKTKSPWAKTDDINSIVFQNVSFGYTNKYNYMEDISFTIQSGTSFGIVGITGSGKTTLINLMQRMYDATSGNILIEGVNIKDYPKDEIRGKIGVVPQQNVLFSGTIAENMRFGNPGATLEDIEKALKTAQCWDFISTLPKGIDAPVYEGGKNFSGGQKQRLAIARALVKTPDILILDDSLSALDYQTDLNLRRGLKEYSDSITTVTVSQRISSVISADKILVMDNGNLSGIGSHKELLQSCSVYEELYNSQVDDSAREGA